MPAGLNLDNQHADYTAAKAARDKSRDLSNGIRSPSDCCGRDPRIAVRAARVCLW